MDPLQRLARIILLITNVQIEVRKRKSGLLVPATFNHVGTQLDLLTRDLECIHNDFAANSRLVKKAALSLRDGLTGLSLHEVDRKLDDIRSPLLILQENLSIALRRSPAIVIA